MAAPSIPGKQQEISNQTVFIIVGVLISLHIVAFGFWVYQLAQQARKDKKSHTE